MNTKALVPLALAVVLGLMAAFLVRAAMSHKQVVPVGPSNLVTVAVAKLDADPGHAITADDVTTAKLPADAIPAGVFSDPTQLVGRVTINPVVRGQTILETMLAPTGSAAGLAALVPPGMRAVTVEVSEFTGVGGMLEPGCRVDVLSVMADPAKKGSVARTVLQNIKVQAIGRAVATVHPQPGQPAPPPSNSVTLLVTPKQAQMLELATNTSRPCLVLRNARETNETQLDSTTLAELQGNPNGDGSDQTNVAVDTTPPAPVTPTATTGTTPVVPTPAVATQADTTPVAPAIPAMIRKSITVLNGDVETQMTVLAPNPRATVIDINDEPR